MEYFKPDSRFSEFMEYVVLPFERRRLLFFNRALLSEGRQLFFFIQQKINLSLHICCEITLASGGQEVLFEQTTPWTPAKTFN
ncbi:MAG: hypothetical protein PVH61_38540 [Candidatus Aminicenantes bacterium]|jgi:hypothetical protein